MYLFTILENETFVGNLFNDTRTYHFYSLFISFIVYTIAIKQDAPAPVSQINPTMIFILIVMALMFIIICVVLRLFSK
jgi:hypothetical protein